MTSILANVGVPLFFPQPLLALIALLSMIGIESVLLKRSGKVKFWDVLIANVFSAIWGIPLALLSGLALGTGFDGVAFNRNAPALLDVAVVMFALFAPSLLLSIHLGGWYLRPRFSGLSGRPFWLAVARANSYSYLLLLVMYCVLVTIQLRMP